MPLAATQPLVLVVEDDPSNQILLARLLARAGYRSLTVATGRDGLRAAMEENPAVVLLDVGLPDMSGLHLCRLLRDDPRTIALPILLVTGSVATDVVAGLEAGADDFIRKPYDHGELVARVRSVLRTAAATAEVVGARGVLAALANAVEAKDAATELHCQRLAGFAHAVGQSAGLEPTELKALMYGALLHDIGKIGVGDAILAKDGPLSEAEWVEMRKHPLIGERICEPLPTAAAFVPIIRHHHERWDGRGYPDGLAGDAIPVGARIVAVVDAFDAMVSGRLYRGARSVDEALDELRRESGSQFDPEVVRLAIPIIEGDGHAESLASGLRTLEALRAIG